MKERLSNVALFGSQARGDAEPGSDIDVLVVLKGEVSPCDEIAATIDIIAGLSLEHGETIRIMRCFIWRSNPSVTW